MYKQEKEYDFFPPGDMMSPALFRAYLSVSVFIIFTFQKEIRMVFGTEENVLFKV